MVGLFLYLFFMILFFHMNLLIEIQFMYMFLFIIFLYGDCYMFFSKISYMFGVDIFSYNLILMGFLISSLMVISMFGVSHMNFFTFINVLMSIFLLIIFTSLNFFFMYMSFEFILVPLLILILGWGYQPERLMAGLYLFFYTVLVSLPLLILLVDLYLINGCLFFDYLSFNSNFFLIHFILLIVFMVKLPMYFVHFWLPKAHVQAPVSGSMILAGLMLSIGGYGLIRITYIYEFMFLNYSFVWFSISLVGSLLISVTCLIQADMKCLIAFSSVSHMGMVIMGLMTMSFLGLMGSFLLMLGHGFCSSGMFYMANLFYSRSSSRSFFINKGLMVYMPSCSLLWFLLCIFNMGCPPSLNFLSEVMILISLMNFWLGSVFFFLGISFFCACFSYYLYSYSQHGLFHNLYSFSQLSMIEFLCLFMHLIPLLVFPLIITTIL